MPGVLRVSSGWVRLLALLRPLSRLPQGPRRRHAAVACTGREAVRRLSWHDAADHQTANSEVHDAQVFVAAMDASSFTYAEALQWQELRCWLSAHVNTFEFLDGVPHVTMPDHLKAGVTKLSFYYPTAASAHLAHPSVPLMSLRRGFSGERTACAHAFGTTFAISLSSPHKADQQGLALGRATGTRGSPLCAQRTPHVSTLEYGDATSTYWRKATRHAAFARLDDWQTWRHHVSTLSINRSALRRACLSPVPHQHNQCR